jgi:hypothetical protein
VIHGRYPAPDNIRFAVDVLASDGIDQPFLGLVGTNLHNVIRRWLRGFHAALYGEFLANDTPNYLHPPFPFGNRNADNQVTVEPILDQQRLFVEIIKKNRAAGALDRIECFNSKCIYECVWESCDDGRPICIFALNLYDWKQLADSENFPPRGCVGMYSPNSGKPEGATQSTSLDVTFTNQDTLDPFAD